VEDKVLDFWFGAPGTPEYGTVRDVWFRKDAAFDATIASQFGALVTRELAGIRADDPATPRGALARVLLLDQFTRNIYRDTAAAFAGDAQRAKRLSARQRVSPTHRLRRRGIRERHRGADHA